MRQRVSVPTNGCADSQQAGGQAGRQAGRCTQQGNNEASTCTHTRAHRHTNIRARMRDRTHARTCSVSERLGPYLSLVVACSRRRAMFFLALVRRCVSRLFTIEMTKRLLMWTIAPFTSPAVTDTCDSDHARRFSSKTKKEQAKRKGLVRKSTRRARRFSSKKEQAQRKGLVCKEHAPG